MNGKKHLAVGVAVLVMGVQSVMAQDMRFGHNRKPGCMTTDCGGYSTYDQWFIAGDILQGRHTIHTFDKSVSIVRNDHAQGMK